MVDFSKLKATSGKKSLEAMAAEASKLTSNENSREDDRFWQPTVDKAGNGYAVIRFLPAPGEEDVPFVRVFEHGFQGPGGWYIENSLTTLGKNDPVSDYNTRLWNSGIEANKEIARKQKRKLTFISNIYVITDSGNPANEGKVFLFRYGKKIFDKLNEAMNPPKEFVDEQPVNPFDLWAGANFKLKIRNVEGYRNYDKSEFSNVEPLDSNDEKLETIWKSEHSLQQFIDPSKFKTYEELQERLNKVLAEGSPAAARKTAENEEIPWKDNEEAPAPSFKTTHAPNYSGQEEDDESLEFFKNLAK